MEKVSKLRDSVQEEVSCHDHERDALSSSWYLLLFTYYTISAWKAMDVHYYSFLGVELVPLHMIMIH